MRDLSGNPVRFLLSALAGAVLPVAFAPFEQFWVAPLSFAVLFWVWRDSRPGRAFWLGTVYGLTSFGAGTYWTYIAVHDFGGTPVAFAAAVSLSLVVTLALFVGVVGFASARWFKTSGVVAWLVGVPAMFVLLEWLRGWILTGFGWLSAGYSQTDSWLMGLAPIIGIHGMSWAVLVSGGALLALATGAKLVRVIGAVVLVAIWGAAFAVEDLRWTDPRGRPLDVALVQGAVKQDLKWRPEQLPLTMTIYRELTEQSAGSELVIWPEAAIPDLYERVTDYLEEIEAWSKQHGSVVMLGILRSPPVGSSATFQNVLVALTSPRLVYVKRHLVPYGEYYPVPGFVRGWLRAMDLPYTDALPGDANQPPLPLLGERIGVTICYEDVFGAEQLHYLPDATLLVNVSNDAWFGDSIAPHQHLQIARVRAAEAGRFLLRSTNTGVSAIIDPHGAIVGRVPQFAPAVLKGTVEGYIGATPYARWGNYPVLIAVVVALLGQLLTTKFTIRPRT